MRPQSVVVAVHRGEQVSNPTADPVVDPDVNHALTGLTVDDAGVVRGDEDGRQGGEVLLPVDQNGYRVAPGDGRTEFAEKGVGQGGRGIGHFDRVIVSDILHEYSRPATPSAISLDTSVQSEISATWTNNSTWRDEVKTRFGPSGGSLAETGYGASQTSESFTGLFDGERYRLEVTNTVYQYRNGTKAAEYDGVGAAEAVTILPAPTSFTHDGHTTDSISVSWVDNHNYGDTELQIKPSDGSWTVDAKLSRGDGNHTFSGLRNGEEYVVRAVAATEHTTTEDTS